MKTIFTFFTFFLLFILFLLFFIVLPGDNILQHSEKTKVLKKTYTKIQKQAAGKFTKQTSTDLRLFFNRQNEFPLEEIITWEGNDGLSVSGFFRDSEAPLNEVNIKPFQQSENYLKHVRNLGDNGRKQVTPLKQDDLIKESSPKPDIHFEKTKYDFGKIIQGEKITFEQIFKFRNLGNSLLHITKVQSSCGCVAVLLSNDIIPPEGQGEIKLTFKPYDRTGPQKKRIIVYSNDPNKPMVQLQYTGFIQRVFNVSCNTLYFGKLSDEKSNTKTIKITSALNKSFTIKKLECTGNGRFNINLNKISEKQLGLGYVIEITVKFLKKDAVTGNIRDSLKVYTDDKRVPVIHINLMSKVEGNIQVDPEILLLGALKPGQVVTKSIIVSTNKGENFDIIELENELDFILTELKELIKGKKYEIIVYVDPSGYSKTSIQDHILIKTDSKVQPVLISYIYGYILRKK